MVYWKRIRDEQKEGLIKGASWDLVVRARRMRKDGTDAEKILWEFVRNKKLGVKFRRQHPLERFIVDFYCHEKGLVVEVDGCHHEDQEKKEEDENRSAELERMGMRVIRFKNEEVLNAPEKVLEAILKEVQSS